MIRTIFLIWFLACFIPSPAQLLSFGDPRRMELEKEYTSGLFRSTDAWFLVPMDDPSAPASINIFRYLQGRVPGLMIYNASGPTPWVFYRNTLPAFFLDEMRVDASLLAMIDINNIAIVKVFRPPFLGAIGAGSGGAIAVYTQKGMEEEGNP